MAKHPFQTAIEDGVSREQLGAILDPDVTMWAPLLTDPVRGRELVLDLLAEVAQVAAPITYSSQVADQNQTLLFWDGTVAGHPMQGVTILTDGTGGRIREIRAVLRPWPVVNLLVQAVRERIGDRFPATAWELGPKADGGRVFTPIALGSLPPAPDMVLHSPILAKAVTGGEEVAEAVRLAHQVQSESSYTCVIATPDRVIELFDCDADGYPMEGIWDRRLNSDGQVTELSVYLRPFPAVTVLHFNAKTIAQRDGFLAGEDYWELPDGG